MDEKILRARLLCLEQAQGFIDAAERLDEKVSPHVVYHLSLLALEEVGKASMLSTQILKHPTLDGSWIERGLSNHVRKLHWAVWSPMARIDPSEFEAARQFAERSHAMRLASLYVDPDADLTALPPIELIRPEDAVQTLSLARTRLGHERGHGAPSGEIDELTQWFLDTVADPAQARVLLSKPIIAQYEVLKGDARAWVRWARAEIAKLDEEAQQTLHTELARPAAEKGKAKARWRATTAVYSPSHSIRPKVLKHWNDKIDLVQFLWSGKKDEFRLQLTLYDNEPLPSLFGRLTSLAKLVIACLNMGSIGYFWFEPPGFEKTIFKDIHDITLNRPMEIGRTESFWDDHRAMALTTQHIDNAVHCMMAFTPLSDALAEPIFGPYLNGLAFIAKSDVYYNFDLLARQSFVSSLGAALRHYGGWSGKPNEFESKFHECFSSFMPEQEHRDRLLKSLTVTGDTTQTSLVNLRTAKNLADLYLVHTASKTWTNILGARQVAK
jgi:AbiV family abortive infection protein